MTDPEVDQSTAQLGVDGLADQNGENGRQRAPYQVKNRGGEIERPTAYRLVLGGREYALEDRENEQPRQIQGYGCGGLTQGFDPAIHGQLPSVSGSRANAPADAAIDLPATLVSACRSRALPHGSNAARSVFRLPS